LPDSPHDTPTTPIAPSDRYAWPLAALLQRLDDLSAWGIAQPRLFPLRGGTADGPAAKAPHPSIRSWPTDARTYTPDAATELAGRFAADTIPGIGIVTGEVVIIDIDDPAALAHPDNERWHAAIRPATTLTLASVGKGYPHYAYRSQPPPSPTPPPTPTFTSGPIGHPRFGDCKATGGYVVLANAAPLANLPVAPVPDALVDLLARAGRVTFSTPTSAPALPTPPTPALPTPTPTSGRLSLADVCDWYADHAPGSRLDATHQATCLANVTARFDAMLVATRDLAVDIMAGVVDADFAVPALFDFYCDRRSQPIGSSGSDDTPQRRADFVRCLADDVDRLRDLDPHDERTTTLLDAIAERSADWLDALDDDEIDLVERWRTEADADSVPPPPPPTSAPTPTPTVTPTPTPAPPPAANGSDASHAPPAPPPPSAPAPLPAAPPAGTGPPLRLDEAAFLGPLGTLARSAAREAQVAPEAVLVQAYALLGLLAGQDYLVSMGNRRFPLAVSAVLVGESGIAAKGTSAHVVREAFGDLSPLLTFQSVSGFGSGQMLVSTLSDLPGIQCWWVSEEFVEVLARGRGSESVMSQTLRKVLDHAQAETRARGSGAIVAKAGSYSISLVGHTTPDEISMAIRNVDLTNGLLNRFAWVRIVPPDHKPMSAAVSDSTFDTFRDTVVGGAGPCWVHPVDPIRMRLTPDADALVESIRHRERVAAVAGSATASITTRGPSFVLRLAGTCALSRGNHTEISVDDVRCADAIWSYCAASTLKIFGGFSGNLQIDALVKEIANSHRDPFDHPWLHIAAAVKRYPSAAIMEAIDRGFVIEHRVPHVNADGTIRRGQPRKFLMLSPTTLRRLDLDPRDPPDPTAL
jgi:hypothetical protein